MLAVHGLVIIASEVTSDFASKYGNNLSFEVASDEGNGKMLRYYVGLWVPAAKVEETKAKIIVGAIAEITMGQIEEYVRQSSYDEKRYSKVSIKIKLENFKFLKPCVYYENLSGITVSKEGTP